MQGKQYYFQRKPFVHNARNAYPENPTPLILFGSPVRHDPQKPLPKKPIRGIPPRVAQDRVASRVHDDVLRHVVHLRQPREKTASG